MGKKRKGKKSRIAILCSISGSKMPWAAYEDLSGETKITQHMIKGTLGFSTFLCMLQGLALAAEIFIQKLNSCTKM